jgi:hypothetical protein
VETQMAFDKIIGKTRGQLYKIINETQMGFDKIIYKL